MFPLSTVLLPGDRLPLQVFEPRYRVMLDECLAAPAPEFGVVLIARGSEVGGGDVRTDVGTMARVEQVRALAGDRIGLLTVGTTPLRVEGWLPDDPYPRAEVVLLDEGPGPAGPGLDEAAAAVERVEGLLSELGEHPTAGAGDPSGGVDGWDLCRRLPLGPLDRQRLLGAPDWESRLAVLVELAGALAGDLARLLAGG
jgi:Lon protease-like protein